MMTRRRFGPRGGGRYFGTPYVMTGILIGTLLYIGTGAACCAHPIGDAHPRDFTWRGQLAIFCDTLPSVLTWPLVLWHLLRC